MADSQAGAPNRACRHRVLVGQRLAVSCLGPWFGVEPQVLMRARLGVRARSTRARARWSVTPLRQARAAWTVRRHTSLSCTALAPQRRVCAGLANPTLPPSHRSHVLLRLRRAQLGTPPDVGTVPIAQSSALHRALFHQHHTTDSLRVVAAAGCCAQRVPSLVVARRSRCHSFFAAGRCPLAVGTP